MFTFYPFFYSHLQQYSNSKEKVEMNIKKQQMETKQKKLKSIRHQHPFFYFISEIRFFQFESVPLTITLFIFWNVPLLKVLQLFVVSNPAASDIYLRSMLYLSKLFFSMEELVENSVSNSSYLDSNLISMVLSLILLAYLIILTAIAHRYKRILYLSEGELKVFKVFTFIIYMLSFYITVQAFISLLRSIANQAYYFIPLAVFNIAMSFALTFMVDFYSNENNYLSPCSLSRISCYRNSAIQMAKLLLAGTIALGDLYANKNIFVFLLALAYMTIFVIELRTIILKVSYLNETTQIIHELFSVNTFATYAILMVFYFTGDYKIINNSASILITVDALSMWTISLFKGKRKEWLFQGGLIDSHEEGELVWRMVEYIKLLRTKWNDKLSFSSLSIIKHQKQCSNPTCFCSSYHDRNGSELINDKEFMLKFVVNKLRQLKQLNTQSFHLKMININFQLIFLQNYTEVYSKFERINMSSVNLAQSLKEYVVYQYKKQFQEKIYEETKAMSQIKLRHLFEEQVFRKDLIENVTEITASKIKKYTQISQDFCNLNSITQICNEISSRITTVETQWAIFRRMDTYNLRTLEMFLIYFELVLPIRSQIIEIRAMISKRYHSLKFLKGSDEATINKAIYTDNCAVFETAFRSYQDIRITNISHSCCRVLHLERKEVMGKEIHEVMSNYICNAHRQLVADKLANLETLKRLEFMLDVYFVDFKGHCFSGKIHIKICSVGDQITFYVLLMKADENNYLVIDENLIIQGIGRRIERQQVFYRENNHTPFAKYCKEDIPSLLQDRISLKKNIVVSQIIRKIDTKSLIRYNNLDVICEEELKDCFDTIDYECEVQIGKKYIASTVYYTIKFGEIKKVLKISDASRNYELLKKLANKKGTLIFVNNGMKGKQSQSEMTVFKIEEGSGEEALVKSAEGESRIVLNETSSTASNIKDNHSLSYSQLMIRLKSYLLDNHNMPKFSVPLVKALLFLGGLVIIIFGYLEQDIISRGMGSYIQTFEASNQVNDINQMMDIALNNQRIYLAYCGQAGFEQRCSYLRKTQFYLNNQLFTMMLNAMQVYLTRKNGMFANNYFHSLEEIVTVHFSDEDINIPKREFLQFYFYALQKNTFINVSSLEAHNNLQFLNSNWILLKEMNLQSLRYYQDQSEAEHASLVTIYSSFCGLYLLITLFFFICFHIFLGKCDEKRERITRLYQFIDIEQAKRLVEVEKSVKAMISNGYCDKTSIEAPPKNESKRYSQFIYHTKSYEKKGILIALIVLVALNACILSFVFQFFPVTKRMSSVLQELVKAQNSVFENFLDLKMEVLGNSSVEGQHTSSSVYYLQKLKEVYTTFTPYDPMLPSQLSSITVGDVCGLNRNYVSAWQLDKCRNGMRLGALKKGINAAITSLVRTTQVGSIQFSEEDVELSSYFGSRKYQDLDDQLIFDLNTLYLLKRYVIASFNRALANFMGSTAIYYYIEIAVVVVSLYLGGVLLERKRRDMGELFGVVLQIPQRIFLESKLVMKVITDHLIQQ